VFNILKEEYKEDMELENVTKLAVKCLTKALEARELPPRIKVAVTSSETKKMTILADEKVEGIMKQLGVDK